jgi:putative redox protein
MSIHVELIQTGPTTTRADVRGHAVRVDRPEAKGGHDRGPMGGELLLTSLGGCFASTLLAAAAARDLPLRDLRVRVAAEPAEGPPRFATIAMTVRASCPDPSQLPKLVAIAERGCIVTNTLRAGVPMEVVAEAAPS